MRASERIVSDASTTTAPRHPRSDVNGAAVHVALLANYIPRVQPQVHGHPAWRPASVTLATTREQCPIIQIKIAMHLTTDRLLLREFGEGDWPAVLAYQCDQRYLRFYPWTHRTDEEVRAFVQAFITQHQEQPRTKFQLAICLKADEMLIGNCGIRMQRAGATEADIGYELAPEHWGRGYATEAARAIVALGFNELKLHRLWAHCVADNVASANVLGKLGMRLEGRQRENQWFKDRWWDTLLFGVLEHEWKDRER